MKLEAIIEQLKDEKFADYVALNPPISFEEILEAEKELPFPLPDFYREFLQLANGGVILGDQFLGIYPKKKSNVDLCHPKTLKGFEKESNEPEGSSFFVPKRLRFSMQELIDVTDLVKSNAKAENFEGIEHFFRTLIVICWRDTGDALVVRPSDETLYVLWHTDDTELDGDDYGSLINVLREKLEWLEEPETVIEKGFRWFFSILFRRF